MTQMTARAGLRVVVSNNPPIPPFASGAPPTSPGPAGDPWPPADPLWVAKVGVRGGNLESLEPMQLRSSYQSLVVSVGLSPSTTLHAFALFYSPYLLPSLSPTLTWHMYYMHAFCCQHYLLDYVLHALFY